MQPILSSSSPTHQNPFQVNIDFGEYTDPADVVDAFEDIVIANGTVDPDSLTQNSGGGDVYFFMVHPTLEGPVTVSIPAGAYICTGSGTPNDASNLLTVVYDSSAPAPFVSLKAGESNPTNAPFWVSIDFSESIDGADLSLIEPFLLWTNCSKGSGGSSGWAATGSPEVWELQVSPTVEGTVSVQLGAGAYADAAGNPSLASNVYSNAYDATPPTPHISLKVGESDPSNGPFWVRVDFAESIDAGDLSDIEPFLLWTNCSKGSSGWAATGAPEVWELHVAPIAEGTVSLQLGGGAYKDAAGNDNTSSNVYDNEYDITPPNPVISLSAGQSDPTNGPFWIVIDFNQSMDAADLPTVEPFLSWTNCSKGSGGSGGWAATGDSERWRLHVVPGAEGLASVQLGAGAYTDGAGNGSLLSNLFSIVCDTTAPAPTIALKSGETSPVAGPFWITIDFNESVDAADLPAIEDHVVWTNCSKGSGGSDGWSATGDPEEWDLHVNPTAAGSVALQLGAGAYSDDAGNDNDASNVLSVTYTVPSPGKDVVLMMDFSNSMNWPVTIGSETKAKIEFMRPAINQFIDEWSAFVNAGDRFGLVAFESVATKLTPSLQAFDVGDAQTLVNSVTARGNTAMGPAMGLGLLDLLSANQTNAAYGRDRDAILFADGQDNIPPLVTTTATSFSVAAMESGGYPHLLGPLEVTAGDPNSIPIHTVGIGETSSWLEKLNHISDVSGGIDKAAPTAQIWPGMINGLQDILTEIYSDSSPQVVFRNQGQLAVPGNPGASKTESFVLDGSVKKVLVSISWIGSEPLKLILKKNGRRICRFDKITRKDEQRYLVMELQFPHFRRRVPKRLRSKVLRQLVQKESAENTLVDRISKRQDRVMARCASSRIAAGIRDIHGRMVRWDFVKPVLGYDVTSRGTWEVTVERVNSDAPGVIDYNLSVIADEKAVNCVVTQPSWVYTGRPIRFCVRVRGKDGKPIGRIFSAEVVVSHPHLSAADVLARYNRKLSKTTAKRGVSESTILSAKMASLHQIPSAVSALKQTAMERIQLKPPQNCKKSRGMYCGVYTVPKIPGTYGVKYTIRGYSPEAGMFERVVERTVLVKPRISRPLTEIAKRTVASGGDRQLLITPKDIYGNRVGPGYADTVVLDIGSFGKCPVKDNLDGSYTVTVSGSVVVEGGETAVWLSALGGTLYRGALKNLLGVD